MKRILLAARYYSIEPLGILYLAGAVRCVPGWECKVVLVKESDFEPLYEAVRNWKPDIVGFQIWTGYHISAFKACDQVRMLGVPVVIGGPHATYYHQECARHADWVIKGSGFGLFGKLLKGKSPKSLYGQLLIGALPKGVHFDKMGREESFPMPDRDAVYHMYPELGNSSIKSIFASVGCPFTCTYCYAPSFNDMHGGFRLTTRPVDEIVAEAQAILKHWPLEMVYFQDDIFGYSIGWLEEFATKWKEEIGIPFHCQIRLELANHASGDKRLDLFRSAGCSGITLAIESGNAFLREYVLFRHMRGDAIEEGCHKIMSRGMTLRTEQILAVPFSDVSTDLATLALNNRIHPTMMWTSILAPYGGTDMGTIATNFGLYEGNNDDLDESFFNRSILRHVRGGPRDIEDMVSRFRLGPKDLLEMQVVRDNGHDRAEVVHQGRRVGEIGYLDDQTNKQYCDDTVRLQRHVMWLAKLPDAEVLARKLLVIPQKDWSWKNMGEAVRTHLNSRVGYRDSQLCAWETELARQMGYGKVYRLPQSIVDNPWCFIFLPEGAGLAHKVIEAGIFEASDFAKAQDDLSTVVRRHVFHYGLYKIEKGAQPIASL